MDGIKRDTDKRKWNGRQWSMKSYGGTTVDGVFVNCGCEDESEEDPIIITGMSRTVTTAHSGTFDYRLYFNQSLVSPSILV